MRTAYLGPAGSWSHQAALDLAHQFGDIHTGVAAEMRIAEDFLRQGRIARPRKYQGPFERVYQSLAQPSAPSTGNGLR